MISLVQSDYLLSKSGVPAVHYGGKDLKVGFEPGVKEWSNGESGDDDNDSLTSESRQDW